MHEMRVESLNIGLPKKEIFHGKEVTTGIGKGIHIKYPLPLRMIFSIMTARIVMESQRFLPFRPFLRPGSAPFKS
jgi:hypothetical protein